MQTDSSGNIESLSIKVMPAGKPQLVKTEPWIIMDQTGTTIGVVVGRQMAEHFQRVFDESSDLADQTAEAHDERRAVIQEAVALKDQVADLIKDLEVANGKLAALENVDEI